MASHVAPEAPGRYGLERPFSEKVSTLVASFEVLLESLFDAFLRRCLSSEALGLADLPNVDTAWSSVSSHQEIHHV